MTTSAGVEFALKIDGFAKNAEACEALHRASGRLPPKLPGIGGIVMDRHELLETVHLGFRFAVLCFFFFGAIVALIPAS
jgi:hypothetical protein